MTASIPPFETNADFQDRRTGLIVFGVLLILLGLLTSLLIPVMIFGYFMSKQLATASAISFQMLLPSLLMYGALSVAFIWLGAGSIACRRWARALLLVLSSLWLATGIEAMAIMACVLPYILDHPSQKSAALTGPIQAVVTAIVFGIDGTIFVIIPLVLFLFYRSKHVKATCEARDPKVRWTDACPLPVLALSLLLALGSVSLPFTMLSHGSVVPMFGFYVSGLPASAVMILMAIVYGFAAWSCYNLKIQGWWAGLIALLGTSISFGITIARIGILPMYELMKVPQAQIEQMRAMGFLDTPFFPLTMFAVFVPYVAFIIFTRRYFKKAEVLQ